MVQFYGWEHGDDAGMVFAYYKEGATDPTLLCYAQSLKEVKCWDWEDDARCCVFSF